MFPIRPPPHCGVPGCVDQHDGFASVGDSPILVDRSSLAGIKVDDGEELVDSDSDEGFRQGRGIPEPLEPSPADVARHNLTHLPYRTWCPHCVAARRANSAHVAGTSADRSVPLLVLDYCFVRDSESQDNLTVLVGKMYPFRNLFGVVCTHKGASDEYTVGRLCQFIRECGVTNFVYKTDQENAVQDVVNGAIRRSKTAGDRFQGVIDQASVAVPELSAVGQSQSNS